ncbi:MAG: hypothetical protein ABH822_02620 [Patescibacteria group bacterium]
MSDFKQRFFGEVEAEVKKVMEEIEESEREIKDLESKIKVERKMSESDNLKEEIAEDIKYSVQALESMLLMEENRKAELERGFEMARLRKETIKKFEEVEL